MVHVPKQQSRKWDQKSYKAIFIGCPEGKKGYRLYNPCNKEKYIEQDKEEDTYFIPITETIEEQITDVKEIHDKTTSEAEDELEEPREYVKSPRPQLFSTVIWKKRYM
ncbi:hypothetical protein TKK_0007361 [Trichogramma kaykai]